MKALRRAFETLFFLIERAVTAALYPVCLLRKTLGAPAGVPILMYHQVGGRPSCHDRVSPERFERQIRAILDAGYRVIPLSELIHVLKQGRVADLGRAAVLTFDDGYRGQFAFAYPILRWNRLPATFFVTAGSIGTNTFFPHLSFLNAAPESETSPPLAWLPLSWDEVKEMAGHGIDIEPHAASHRSLGHLAAEEAASEALESKELLERRLGVPVDLFAYPLGWEAYGDFHRGNQDVLRATGYRAACTTMVGRSGPGVDPLALPRIPMEQGDGPFRVRCKLAGAYDWVGAAKSLWQRLAVREERVDAAHPAGMDTGIGP